MQRAYSLLEVKAVNEDNGFFVINGVATTPSPDRALDVVEPLGARFAKEIPLLWIHQHDKPVGIASFGKPTKSGIPFTARLPIIKEPGILKDRVDEAIQSITHRLAGAVSIGFRVLNDAYENIKGGGIRFLETEILELSLCVIPMHPEAQILGYKSMSEDAKRAALLTQIKSIDTEQRAAFIRKSGSVKLLAVNKEEAVISAVKSVDQKALSAIGHGRNKSALEISPGATGKKRRPIQLIPRK